ncbi:group II intron reverse transcriptase/maturase [Candidatus Woesearchaeota archaeon]|nr:group II intron reverse transcriptase/maturase [Candidatus Woesearchaeota archaeon]
MKHVIHSAIDKVYKRKNLKAAADKICRNKGAAGVDEQSIKAWKKDEDRLLSMLQNRLYHDTYRSKPVKRVYIDKPGSKKKRPLGVPTVSDRICQQAVLNIISPIFERYFHEESYGFRPGRSTKSAAGKIEAIRREGYRTGVDIDIKGFFDNVNHEILIKLVRKVIKDRRVLGLIRGWLKAGVMEEGNVRFQISGTPQGGVVSPILSNIYLTPLDIALEQNGYKFVRYADDALILCRSKEEAEKALIFTCGILERMKLQLNEEKTKIVSFEEGFDFLGFHFGKRARGVGTKSLKAFYMKVRKATKRQQGDKPLEKIIENLNPILRGWGNYHNAGRNVGLFTRLDRWVRNRLRSYKWKRWRDRPAKNVKPSREDFQDIGLFSMRSIFRPEENQLCLF